MTISFEQLPIGALFEFRGRRYRKVAVSMAHDEERMGNIFQHRAEVVPDVLPQPRTSMETARAGAVR